MSSTGNPDELQNDDPGTEILPFFSRTDGAAPDVGPAGVVPVSIAPVGPPANRLGAVLLHTERLRTADAGAGKKKSGVLNVVVLTLAAGLVGTMAIPAYAFDPSKASAGQFGTSTIGTLSRNGAQSVSVGTVDASAVDRDPLTATSPAELAAEQAAAARAAVAAKFANYEAAYSGPSVADFLANPPYPSFSLAQVFQVAQKYIGVPYVFGGATPAGFDCSGFVMFVYAQFGIALPHSVSGIAARGTRISIADAVPGDLIVMPGHIGFYAGNGNILDAPDSGKSISIRPIWTTDYYVVRLGI